VVRRAGWRDPIAFRGLTTRDARRRFSCGGGIRTMRSRSPVLRTPTSSSFHTDGRWICILGGRKLKKIPVGGGDVTTLCDVGLFRGGDWTMTDTSSWRIGSRTGLSGSPIGERQPEAVHDVEHAAGEIHPPFPQVLPVRADDVSSLRARPSVSYDARRFMAQAVNRWHAEARFAGRYAARYVESGHLLYAQRGRCSPPRSTRRTSKSPARRCR
jgi:hypothetical protein